MSEINDKIYGFCETYFDLPGALGRLWSEKSSPEDKVVAAVHIFSIFTVFTPLFVGILYGISDALKGRVKIDIESPTTEKVKEIVKNPDTSPLPQANNENKEKPKIEEPPSRPQAEEPPKAEEPPSKPKETLPPVKKRKKTIREKDDSDSDDEKCGRSVKIITPISILCGDVEVSNSGKRAIHEILPHLFLGGMHRVKEIYSYGDELYEEPNFRTVIAATRLKAEGGFGSLKQNDLSVTELEQIENGVKTREEKKPQPKIFRFPQIDKERDHSLANVKLCLDLAIDAIEDSLKYNKPVLVYCQKGDNLAPTIVIAYIMSKYKVGFDTALHYVTNKRQIKLADDCVKFLKEEFQPLKLSEPTNSI